MCHWPMLICVSWSYPEMKTSLFARPGSTVSSLSDTNEPPHDKTNKMAYALSIGIRPVWSESLLSAWK